jgi:hypothetical protein
LQHGTLTFRVPVRVQALLFKRTTLGFTGQIALFFQHTKRLDS